NADRYWGRGRALDCRRWRADAAEHCRQPVEGDPEGGTLFALGATASGGRDVASVFGCSDRVRTSVLARWLCATLVTASDVVSLLESWRHDGSSSRPGKNRSPCQRRGTSARCEPGGGPDLLANACDYQHRRTGIARCGYFRIGGWRDLGSRAHRGFSAEVLLRRKSFATEPDGAAGDQVCARTMDRRAVGAGVGNAHVRIPRHAAGSSAGNSCRSCRARAAVVGISEVRSQITEAKRCGSNLCNLTSRL